MIPYLIISPRKLIHDKNYANKSAGVRVLEKLCLEMNKRGAEAYLTDGRLTPEIGGTVEKTIQLIESGAIVVYHENCTCNALRSQRPVGYVLGEWHRPPQNKFCSEMFYYDRSLGQGNQLTIDVVEHTWFNNKNPQSRIYDTVYIGKGDIGGFIGCDIENQQHITASWPRERSQVANLLKQSRAFYTCDGNTALSSEARLCGCPVVFRPNRIFTWEDCQRFNHDNIEGIGLTLDEAEATMKNFEREYYRRFDPIEEALNITRFFEITQKMEAKCPSL